LARPLHPGHPRCRDCGGTRSAQCRARHPKGYHPGIDSYSGFLEADRRTPTGLAGYLKERSHARVFCAGLATDFCVAWTALDAARAGFETYVIEDASRGIDTDGSLARALADLDAAGVTASRPPTSADPAYTAAPCRS
jgi:nicotinamidase-related amidase